MIHPSTLSRLYEHGSTERSRPRGAVSPSEVIDPTGPCGPRITRVVKRVGSLPAEKGTGMQLHTLALIGTVGLLAGSSFAGVATTVAFNSLIDWTEFAAKTGSFPAGWTTATTSESFESKQPLTQTSISGGMGWSSWTAFASSGSVTQDFGAMSTAKSGTTLFFDLGGKPNALGGLHGIAGDFGFIDANGEYQPGRIEMTLSSGASIVQEFTAKTSFAGFWITDPEITITGLSLKPLSNVYAVSTSNLYFGFAGVPAPGACALLFIASVFASGRRRTSKQ